MPAKDPQCADCPLHSGYQYPIRATRDESGSPGGWYCIGGEFVPEHEAPLVGCCDYFEGYQHGHEHQLDVALKRQSDEGDELAVEWLAGNVPSHLLWQAWQAAPESGLDRARKLYNAESRSEHAIYNDGDTG